MRLVFPERESQGSDARIRSIEALESQGGGLGKALRVVVALEVPKERPPEPALRQHIRVWEPQVLQREGVVEECQGLAAQSHRVLDSPMGPRHGGRSPSG